MTNICTQDLEASKAFYTKLFDFKVNFDSDWFVQLVGPKEQLELGIIKHGHELVPAEIAQRTGGFYITFVVDDLEVIHNTAKEEHFEIIRPPKDTPYGQRQLLLKDPNGVVVDVSSPIPR